jgi:predicted ATP-binding protein involved in virulence
LELLYLRVENKKQLLDKVGLNFSDELNFTLYENKLIVKRNNNFIPNFFNLSTKLKNSKSSFSNITAIVGENGAGKSTVLDIIKNNIVDGMGGVKEKAIIIFRKNNNKKRIYIWVHKDLKIALDSESFNNHDLEYDFEIYSEEIKAEILIKYSYIKQYTDTSFIFFSNIYDGKDTEQEFGDLINISTNHLIRSDQQKYLEVSLDKTVKSESAIHRNEEIKRQVFFLNSFRDNKIMKDIIPFKLPSSIKISLLDIDITKDRKLSTSKFKDYISKYNKIINEQMKKDLSYNDIFILHFHKTILNNIFYETETFNKSNSELLTKVIYEVGDNLEFELNLQDVYQRYLETPILPKIKKLLETLSNYDKTVLNILETIKYVEMYLIDHKVSYNLSFDLEVSDDTNFNLNKLMDFYKESFRYNGFFNFNWDLSSGEKALLNTYSRFYSIIGIEKLQLKEDLCILIDEGEVFLHPYWQKRFLTNLFSFLPQVFGGKSIQVIFTSNSPFLISDLPTSNVILLEKENNKVNVINSLNDNKRTFAANIHTLLSDSFFIKDGLIGEFAKEKINDFLENINKIKKIKDEADFKEHKKFIDLIGEPIIRNQIYKLVYKKLDQSIIDQEKKELHKRLEMLDRGLKGD